MQRCPTLCERLPRAFGGAPIHNQWSANAIKLLKSIKGQAKIGHAAASNDGATLLRDQLHDKFFNGIALAMLSGWREQRKLTTIAQAPSRRRRMTTASLMSWQAMYQRRRELRPPARLHRMSAAGRCYSGVCDAAHNRGAMTRS